MSHSVKCPKCGAVVPAGSPAGICPACLMEAGLKSSWVDLGTRTHHSPAAPGSPFIIPEIKQLSPLFPQLELIRPIGHGGMGAVYLARQKSLDRLVALKILRPESAGKEGFADRFAREARALARLNHPGIVAIHDFGSVEISGSSLPDQAAFDQDHQTCSLFYLLMEFVDGANVRQLISSGRLLPAEALAIVPQICEALQFAHDMGIVHRDIKPENILLDQRGRVKIADFGLAKLSSLADDDRSLTGTHQIMGTPRYMAPEQLEQTAAIDHRADIYSLGVVFYEMLTGEIPMGMFDPPSKKVQVDVRLDHVVLRSLAREPDRRYQQVSEIKNEMDSMVAGDEAISPPAHGDNDKRRQIFSDKKEPVVVNRSFARGMFLIQLAACALGIAASLVPNFYYSSCFWGIAGTVSIDHGPLTLNEIEYDSPAWQAGFRSGDRIIEPPDYRSIRGALSLVETGLRGVDFKVQRDAEQVSIRAEPVARQFARVDYLSPWYPVAGFVFLILGLLIFIGHTPDSKALWPSFFVLAGGVILVTGSVVAFLGHSIFTNVVIWQAPGIALNNGFRSIHLGQPYLAIIASLILIAAGSAGLRNRLEQRGRSRPAGEMDPRMIVAGPATALTIVAWLAIPAAIITPILLFFLFLILDAAGF